MDTQLTVENMREELAKSADGQWSLFDEMIQAASDAGSDGLTAGNVYHTTLIDKPTWDNRLERVRTARNQIELYAAVAEIQNLAAEWSGLAD